MQSMPTRGVWGHAPPENFEIRGMLRGSLHRGSLHNAQLLATPGGVAVFPGQHTSFCVLICASASISVCTTSVCPSDDDAISGVQPS